jgi:hypothetical protein
MVTTSRPNGWPSRHPWQTSGAALFVGALMCFYFAVRRDAWSMAALDGLES